MKRIFTSLLLMVPIILLFQEHTFTPAGQEPVQRSPNILFAIADDQSFPHASAYGLSTFRTPTFDRVAARGMLFNHAFVAAPQCSPSRAAILTGRQIWQLEEAGTHSSYFPKKFPVFTDALENAGYFIGYTGKPWGPGNAQDAGWSRNPVGPEYNQRQFSKLPTKGISKTDYAANFKDFLSAKPADKPFFFWYGGQEPHRDYEEGSGAKAGLSAQHLTLPSFLPDTEWAKNDLLDYALEIEWFDAQLGKILQMLEEAGELDNTLIVVTSDNGMPFPYAKANLQEYGTHVPLAICGPGVKGKNRKVDDFVSLIDLAPTFLDLAQVKHFKGITGRTLMPLFNSTRSGYLDRSRQFVLTGRERHTHARPDNLGYPARAIRTRDYLYIKNFAPDRWPLGDPAPEHQESIAGKKDLKPILEGYEDVDDSPTKSLMIKNKTAFPELFRLSFEKRGTEELYDLKADPYCLHDLSKASNMLAVTKKLNAQLTKKLKEQGDPRMGSNGDIFDSYPRFGLMRPFAGFKERGKYNPQFTKKQ